MREWGERCWIKVRSLSCSLPSDNTTIGGEDDGREGEREEDGKEGEREWRYEDE
jgi:hypothetical protein